ncbi:hypothetical protein pdam_00002505 [Pocillopora damicornis]|uniref:15-hydroxyprostaglandin dehydrogenase [NAD(+)] n=1 Tax=Pocillopora damicornis TaxID=46731 RepID=A0A3M6TRQ1_POCDA|nr:hypothetical protein pdam_00002505 [Pocillopora damicornis]
MKIQGCVAIVTGGAQGIGEKICRALLEKECKVAILDLNHDKGLQLQESLERQYGSGKVIFIRCDVSSKSQMKDSFKKTKEVFGQINIVCNNAGISSKNEEQEEEWDKEVDVNLKSVIHGTFLGVHHMSRMRGGMGGVVINVASMAEWRGLYETEGVRVNCICPSYTETDLFWSSFNEKRAKETPNFQTVLRYGLIRPEVIATGVIQLIEKDSTNAAVMMVTKNRGIEIMRPRGSRISKL